MPSAKQKQDLYMGKTLADLNKLADPNLKSKNPTVLVKSAKKLYQAAEENYISGDEEKAYVLFMRFMNIFMVIKKTSEYKKDERYFKNLLGVREIGSAMEKAEELSESLKERYEYIEAEQVSARLSSLPELDPVPSHNPGGSDVTPASPSPLGQGEEKKQEEEEAPEPVALPPRTGAVEVSELYSLVQENSSQLLLLDARPGPDFTRSHIRHSRCISVPEECLKPGCVVRVIEPAISEGARAVWDKRGKFSEIVLIDWRSTLADVILGTPLAALKDAIYKWDGSVRLPQEPRILEGGYERWGLHYPTLCTAPVSPTPQLVTPANGAPASLADIQYPDLNEVLFGKKPSPPASTQLPAAEELPDIDFPPSSVIPSASAGSSASVTAAPRVDRKLKPSAAKPQAGTLQSNTVNTPQAPIPRPVSVSSGSLDSHARNASSGSVVVGGQELGREGAVEEGRDGEEERGVPQNRPASAPSVPRVDRSVKPSMPNKDEREAAERAEAEERARVKQQQQEYITNIMARFKKLKVEESQLEQLKLEKQKQVHDVSELMRMKRRLEEEFRQLELRRTQEAKQAPAPSVSSSSGTSLSSSASSSEAGLDKPDDPRPSDNRSSVAPNSTTAEGGILKQPTQPPKQPTQPPKPPVTETPRPPVQQPTVPATQPTVTPASQARGTAQQQPRAPSTVPAAATASQPHTAEARNSDSNRMFTREGLPEGWEKKLDQMTGRFFFVDHRTRTTHWELPPGIAHTRPAAPAAPVVKTQPKPAVGQVTTTKLKDDSTATPRSGGLKRAQSTPDLSQLEDEPKPAPLPGVARDTKPKPRTDVLKSLDPQYSRPTPVRLEARDLRALNPTYGSVKSGLTGLRNLGNTCFMNSVIQCLSNTTPLVSYFNEGKFRLDVNLKNKLGHGGNIAQQFAVLVKVLWTGQYKTVSPINFKDTVSRYYWQFHGAEQHDAQEFMLFLMDGLHEDMNRVEERKALPEQNNEGVPDVQAAKVAWNNHKFLNQSIIVELFQGQFKSTVQCLTCQKQSVTFDAFMYLSVPIPSSRRCSLKDCYKEFLKAEKMTGSSRWKCPRCKVPRDAVKQIDIWKLPPFLLIHLKRFWYEGHLRQKIAAQVDYPLRGLDLRDVCRGPEQRRPYDLYSVVNHFGSMDGGHYIAHCLSSVTRSWHKYDDDAVSSMSASSAQSAHGYILFYTAMDQRPPALG